MKSNFLSLPIIPKEEKPVVDKENTNTANEPEEEAVAEPDPEEEKEKKVKKILSRMNRQLCYLNLESSNQIFKIYW